MQLTDIISRYQDKFFTSHGHRLEQRHLQAVRATLTCRTGNFGEVQLICHSCNSSDSYFLSCGNRSCPRCQNHDTTSWLERQQNKLLPVKYYMVTFTLPFELRTLVWENQKALYNAIIQCAVDTLKQFGINDKKLGGPIGLTAVLHTHARRLDFHPHVHIIVPGGCVDKKRKQWRKLKRKYLFNEFNLAKVFRAKFLDAVNELKLTLPRHITSKWIVDCERVGQGLPALKYLSRYLYRGVISEKNIIADDGQNVTFRYIDSETKQWRTRTEKGEDFLWLVFQHVLPKGFRRARDYGILHGKAKKLLELIQYLLVVALRPPEEKPRPAYLCKCCKKPMSILRIIAPG